MLDIEDGKALIISEYILEERSHHTNSTAITWETSFIRQYLNGEFYDNTFSATEKARIVEAMVINNDNPGYGTAGGNDTTDKIV